LGEDTANNSGGGCGWLVCAWTSSTGLGLGPRLPRNQSFGLPTGIGWLHAIDWSAANVRQLNWEDEDYGAVWSRRIWLEPTGIELEVSFASVSWANVNPLDSRTRRVISDGCRVLHDPKGIFRRLSSAVKQAEHTRAQ
jgi:hypothetical protein